MSDRNFMRYGGWFYLCVVTFWGIVFAFVLTFGKIGGVPCPEGGYCPADPNPAVTSEQDDRVSKAMGWGAIAWMYFF